MVKSTVLLISKKNLLFLILAFGFAEICTAQSSITPQNAHKCAVELCGPANALTGFLTLESQDPKANTEIQRIWQNDLLPKLRNGYNLLISEVKFQNLDLKQILSAAPSDFELPELKAYFLLLYSSEIMSYAGGKIIKIKNEKFEMDEVALNLMLAGDKILLKTVKLLLKEVLVVINKSEIQSELNYGYIYYGTQDLKKSVTRALQDVQKLKEKFNNISPGLGEQHFIYSEATLAYASNQTIVDSNQRTRISTVIYQVMLYNIFFDKVENLINNDLSQYKIPFDPKKIQRVISINEETLKLNTNDDFNEFSNKCRDKLQKSMLTRTTGQQWLKFQQQIKLVKGAMKTYLRPLVSDILYKYAEENIDKSEIIMTEGNQSALAILKNNISLVERDVLQKKKIKMSTKDALFRQMATFMTEPENLVSSRELFSSQLCNMEFELRSDYYFPGSNLIYVSPYSVLNLEAGLQIVAHEFWHMLSYAAPKSIIKEYGVELAKQMDCVENRSYVTIVSTTEEDFADYFSTQVSKIYRAQQLANQGPSRLMACSLMSINGGDYSKLSVFPAEGDPHSSSFKRAIVEANDLDRLPKICEPFLRQGIPKSSKVRCDSI